MDTTERVRLKRPRSSDLNTDDNTDDNDKVKEPAKKSRRVSFDVSVEDQKSIYYNTRSKPNTRRNDPYTKACTSETETLEEKGCISETETLEEKGRISENKTLEEKALKSALMIRKEVEEYLEEKVEEYRESSPPPDGCSCS
jgi:hypothetical protein